MSQIHQFKCDACKKRVDAIYNGEHYLPPEGWVDLADSNTTDFTGQNMCPKCVPKSGKDKIEDEE